VKGEHVKDAAQDGGVKVLFFVHRYLPVVADGLMGALLVDPRVHAPVRDDDGTLDPPPAPPLPPPPPPPER